MNINGKPVNGRSSSDFASAGVFQNSRGMELIPVKLLILVILATLVCLSYGRNKPVTRIVSGENATRGQFPHYVRLRIYRQAYNQSFYRVYLCGAALITPKHCLTAAHCTFKASGILATMGWYQNSDDKNSSDVVTSWAEASWWHSGYDPSSLSNDISIVQLIDAVKLTAFIGLIKISCNEADTLPNTSVVVAGSGLTNDDPPEFPSQLQSANFSTISTEECGKYFPFVTDDYILCALSSNRGAVCNGDSGSALIQTMENKTGQDYPVHCGIVSFGSSGGCKTGFPGGYTRTAKYVDWIEAIVALDNSTYTVLCTKKPPATATARKHSTETFEANIYTRLIPIPPNSTTINQLQVDNVIV